MEQLRFQLAHVDKLAALGQLPDVTFTKGILKITPLDNLVPDEAEAATRKVFSLMPHVRITESLLEVALREIGRIERSLFMHQWLQDSGLRRRVQVGLNKGDARNALARAVFFNRLGKMRDRGSEYQNHRARGLNLVVAAITLWNTVYLVCALELLCKQGDPVPDDLVRHLSPLGWERINLTATPDWRYSWLDRFAAKFGFWGGARPDLILRKSFTGFSVVPARMAKTRSAP